MTVSSSPKRVPQRGDVYWIDPNPVAGREMRDRHRFVVVTPLEINKLGVSITVPVTSGGASSTREQPLDGHFQKVIELCFGLTFD